MPRKKKKHPGGRRRKEDMNKTREVGKMEFEKSVKQLALKLNMDIKHNGNLAHLKRAVGDAVKGNGRVMSGTLKSKLIYERYKQMTIVEGFSNIEACDNLGISEALGVRFAQEIKKSLLSRYEKLKNSADQEIIPSLLENHNARKNYLWKESKKSTHPMARVFAQKVLVDNDEKTFKMLQSTGILRNESPNSLEILLSLNRGKSIAETKQETKKLEQQNQQNQNQIIDVTPKTKQPKSKE